MDEHSARPYIALGSIYNQAERYDDAIHLFEIALQKEPGLPLAYMGFRGGLFGSQPRRDKASRSPPARKPWSTGDTSKEVSK